MACVKQVEILRDCPFESNTKEFPWLVIYTVKEPRINLQLQLYFKYVLRAKSAGLLQVQMYLLIDVDSNSLNSNMFLPHWNIILIARKP